MGNAGRHQSTGRGQWRQVLARRRWYGVLGMGAGIAALAGAAVIMPGSHSPRPAARSCGLVRCAASTRRSERKHGQPPAVPRGKAARPPVPYIPSSVRHAAPGSHAACTLAPSAGTRTPSAAPPTRPGLKNRTSGKNRLWRVETARVSAKGSTFSSTG
jgi:hypothetical protein